MSYRHCRNAPSGRVVRFPRRSFEMLEPRTVLAAGMGSNLPPQLGPIPDQFVDPGQLVQFTAVATDPDGPAADLSFFLDPDETPVTSANLDRRSGLFTWTPAATETGIFRFVVLVTDRGMPPLADAEEFTVYVGLNDPPTIQNAPSVVLSLEDEPVDFGNPAFSPISIADGDAGANPIEVAITATLGTLTLAPAANLTFLVGDGSDDVAVTMRGSLADINTALAGMRFVPTADEHGSGRVEIHVDDLGSTGFDGPKTASASIAISIGSVNDAPAFVGGASLAALEDAPRQVHIAWATAIHAGAANESGQALSFLVTTDRPDLFSEPPTISAEGTLIYMPAPNANGVANVSVRLRDDGGVDFGGVDTSPPYNFRITVVAVNDEPTFITSGDVAVDEDAGLVSLVGFATPNAGPANESGQAVTFLVTTDNPNLFVTPPAIAPDGTLTFQSAPNAFGTARLTMRLQDDGGTANGGDDLSAAQSVTITIRGVNDPPDLAAIADAVAVVGQELVVQLSASDVDPGDVLTFRLDPDSSPAAATLTQTSPTTAEIRWTPAKADFPGPVSFVALVLDNGSPQGVDAESFRVVVTDPVPEVDLNGQDGAGVSFAAAYIEDNPPSSIVDADATVSDSNDTLLSMARLAIANLQDGDAEVLSVDVTGTALTASFAGGVLTLTGPDTLANFERVLRTATYRNTSQRPTAGDRSIEFAVHDGNSWSAAAVSTVTVVGEIDFPNLVLPAPYNSRQTPAQASVGVPVTFTVTATDVDGAPGGGDLAFILDLGGSGIAPGDAQPTISSTGVFSWTPSATGTFTIRVIVIDADGAPDQESFAIEVSDSAPQPAGIVEVSPADGEELVNVTRETIVRFDRPIDPATVTTASFKLVAASVPVTGRVVVSSTQRFATFYYENPTSLPPSTAVQVIVDGEQIRDPAGIKLDADGDGVPGGVLVASFRTLPLSRLPGTNVFGYVKDSYSLRPIAGATIRVDAFPEANVTTDEFGRFELVDMPAPEFFVHIDGSTATNAPAGFAYPNVGKPFHSVPGQTVPLNMSGTPFDIYLPPMALADIQPLSNTQATDVGFGAAGLDELRQMFPAVDESVWQRTHVTFPPNSAVDEHGTPATQAIFIPVPPNRIPAPLPPNLNPQLVISIQAVGATTFDVPVPVTFPNLDGLLPGEKQVLMSFNHDAGKWEVVGTGTVSADGLMIESDPDSGIRAPGWHFSISGSLPRITPGADLSDRDESSLLSEIACALPPQSLLTPIAVAAAIYVSSKFEEFGSQLGVAHLSHFLGNTGTPLDYADGSFVSNLVEQSPEFIRQNETVMEFVHDEVQRRIAAGQQEGGHIEIPDSVLQSAGGRIAFRSNPNLFWAIHGTQGLEIVGGIDVDDGGSYSGMLRYTYYDSYGFGVSDTWFGDNRISYQGRTANTLMRHLQICGLAHWFPVTVTVDVPIASASPAAPLAASSYGVSIAGIEPLDAETTSTVSTIAGIGSSPVVYYRYVFDSGLELSGTGQFNQPIPNIVVPPNVGFRAVFYAPSVNRWTTISGVSTASGTPFSFEDGGPTISLTSFGGLDSDGDTLPDQGEFAIGSNSSNRDSDNDGVSDDAELAQGLNPLDNLGFPSGAIANVAVQGTAQAVAVANNNVYVATGPYGLAVVDGSQFNMPVVLGEVDLPGNAVDVAVDAGLRLAAVAAGDTLQIVDVSNPQSPAVARSVAIGSNRVEVAGGLAFTTAGSFLRIVDLASGNVVQTVILPGSGEVTALAREGTHLYAYQSGSDTLYVIDIANEAAAAIRGQVQVSIASSEVGLFVGNGVAWLAGSGLRTVNVGNPAQPQLLHGADSFFTARQVALNGSGLGLVLPDGGNFVQVYGTADPNDTDQLLTQFNLSGAARDVAISRGIAYIAAGNRLEVVNYRPFDAAGQPPTVAIATTAVDADSATPGVQVVEGGAISVSAAVSDDVQVRQVELLLNGQVVATDVAYPFDFFAAAPPVSVGGPAVRLQLRATDTGGNAGFSQEVTIAAVPDTFPPTIVGIDPPHGSRRFQGQRTVRVRFSEAIAAAGVTLANFQLISAGSNETLGDEDDVVLATALQLRDNDRLVQLTTAPLTENKYRLRIDRAQIADRVGNVLANDVLTNDFEVVTFEDSADFLPFGTDIFVNQDDVSVAVSPLPFEFELFGVPVSGAMYVTSNGVVEFDANTIGGWYSNTGLPAGAGSYLAAYPFWDDLDPRFGGRIGVYDGEGVRAVTWENIPYYCRGGTSVSVQVAFLANGTVQFRYGGISPLACGPVTIGLARNQQISVPSLGNIANRPGVGITTSQGLLNPQDLAILTPLPGNDLLVFTPNGDGGYTILHNPQAADVDPPLPLPPALPPSGAEGAAEPAKQNITADLQDPQPSRAAILHVARTNRSDTPRAPETATMSTAPTRRLQVRRAASRAPIAAGVDEVLSGLPLGG